MGTLLLDILYEEQIKISFTSLTHLLLQKLLYLATNCRDIPCWLAGITMPPQYVQQPRGTHRNDADIITLTFQKPDPHMTVLERWSTGLRQQATAFAQKYATFLDGFITLPTKFCSETFER